MMEVAEHIEGSWDVRREVADTFPNDYASSISNHCPVVIRLRDAGNDTATAGDWGTN